ncbi:MAG: hypothetical protein J6G98_05195 [Bacilli bacterium]|nr:hypothetical protein [Bacilli bacterium]
MSENTNITVYKEYINKYKTYNLNENSLKKVEKLCEKTHDRTIGLNNEVYKRVNLYFETLSQLYKKIDELDVIYKYKALVLSHYNHLTNKLDKDEIDILFDDTIDYVKENYDGDEELGSYIVRLFRNNLIDYVNEKCHTEYTKPKHERIIKTLQKK